MGVLGVLQLAMQNLRPTELAIFALPAVLAAFTTARLQAFVPLLLLPAVWIALAIWAGVFWAPHIVRDPPLWLLLPGYAAPTVFFAITLYLVWRSPELRVVTVAFAACNLSLVTRVAFVAGMAVTGIWL